MLFNGRADGILKSLEKVLDRLKYANEKEDINLLERSVYDLEDQAYRLMTEINSLRITHASTTPD